jgi:ABC-type arginine transport system permease subunit
MPMTLKEVVDVVRAQVGDFYPPNDPQAQRMAGIGLLSLCAFAKFQDMIRTQYKIVHLCDGDWIALSRANSFVRLMLEIYLRDALPGTIGTAAEVVFKEIGLPLPKPVEKLFSRPYALEYVLK